ncbi:MAG: hypothetical protein Q9O62_12750 [Ardenticatenia bacterium]|nr:hypothetical protein [Ardenticatenia bacterium]
MKVGHERVAGTLMALWLLMAVGPPRPVQAGPPPCSSVPNLTGMPVTALAPVSLGSKAGLLVGTDRGLWLVRSDHNTGEADVVWLPLPDGPTPVTALATSPDGAVWIATGRGVLYHPATCPDEGPCPFRIWSAEAGELPFRTVLAVAADGVIGGPRGIARWDGQAWQQDPNAPEGVTALLRLNGSLWAATRAGDLWQRDPAGRWRSLPLPGQQPGRALLALDSLPGRLVVAGELGVWAINLDQEGKVQRVAHIADTPVAALVVEGGRSVLTGPATVSSRSPSCQTVSVSAGTISLRQITLPGGEPITTLASFDRAVWVGTSRGLYVYGPPRRWAPAPPRLPVLLVPGLYGADDLQSSQLKFLARALRADGYPVVYVGSLRPDRPLEANARQLHALSWHAFWSEPAVTVRGWWATVTVVWWLRPWFKCMARNMWPAWPRWAPPTPACGCGRICWRPKWPTVVQTRA